MGMDRILQTGSLAEGAGAFSIDLLLSVVRKRPAPA
jgi:hypothetical protein